MTSVKGPKPAFFQFFVPDFSLWPLILVLVVQYDDFAVTFFSLIYPRGG
jgi:hypothetical protein